MKTFSKIALVLVISFLAACGSSSGSDSTHDNGPDTRTGGQALVEGDSEAGPGEQVIVSEVQADGSFRILDDSVTTDANGRYSLEVGHGGSDLLIFVEGAGSVLVSEARLAQSNHIVAAPIDGETTAEAAVFQSALEAGVWNENSTVEGLRDFVSAEFAAEMMASGNFESAADEYALAATAHMTAFSEMLASDLIALDEEGREVYIQSHAEAQAAFDLALDASESGEESEQAAAEYAARAEIIAEGAGLSAEEAALAAEAAAWTTFSSLTTLEGELAGQAYADAHAQLAVHTTAEVEAHIAALGGDVEAIAEAGAQLEAELEAASDTENAAAEIESAWESYEAAIEAELEAALSAHVGIGSEFILAELQVAILASSESLLLALDALAQADSAIAAADLAVAAFADFQLELLAGSFTETLTSLGMSQAEAEAALELYATMAIH